MIGFTCIFVVFADFGVVVECGADGVDPFGELLLVVLHLFLFVEVGDEVLIEFELFGSRAHKVDGFLDFAGELGGVLLELEDLFFFGDTPDRVFVELDVVFTLFEAFANDMIDLARVHAFHERVHHRDSVWRDFTENDVVFVFLVRFLFVVSGRLHTQEPDGFVLDLFDITSREEQHGILRAGILDVIGLGLFLHLIVYEDLVQTFSCQELVKETAILLIREGFLNIC